MYNYEVQYFFYDSCFKRTTTHSKKYFNIWFDKYTNIQEKVFVKKVKILKNKNK